MNRLIWGHRPLDIAQPGITLPFDFGLKQSLRQQGLPTALRQRGLDPAQTPLLYTHSAHLSALQAGYEYDHLTAYQALFQQLPQPLTAEPFMTLLLGSHRTPLSSATANASYPLHFVYTYLKHHLFSRTTCAAFQRQVDTLQLQPENLGALNQLALQQNLEMRINLWLSYAPQHCGQEIDTLVLYSHFARLCQHWGNDSSGALINRLYDAGQALYGTEPLIRIRELAKIANQHPELVTPLCQAPDATLQTILTTPAYAYFKTRLQHYQTQFSYLPLTAFNLHTATLQQTPLLLLRMIGQTAQWLKHSRYTPPEPNLTLPEFTQQYHQRAWFKQMLRQVQHLLQERLDWYQTEVKLYGQIRLITLELGRRLYDQQQLVNPDDVHYLTPFELMGCGPETSLSPELKAMATVRRHAHSSEAQPEALPLTAVIESTPPHSGPWQGIACSPGIVRGPIRRFDPNQEIPVQAGEILVATRLNPGLSLWFPCCAGLIVEQANPLSVVMLLARELGLPAVAQLPTAGLQTGAWIELDGNCGQITAIAPPQNK